MKRLRITRIKPTGANGEGTSNLGLLGNDLAGFPNGRRVTDDVVNIELKAVAGLTIPLVDKTYKPDAAASDVTQGVASESRAYKMANGMPAFPYLADPHGGYYNPPDPANNLSSIPGRRAALPMRWSSTSEERSVR